jgi:tetratricopeptide (TPR) repeat protein
MKGDYQNAIDTYDKILEKSPNNIDALNLKGIILGKSGKYDEAIVCFNKILVLDSDYVPAQENKKNAERLKNQSQKHVLL